jgi:hypothetical protein
MVAESLRKLVAERAAQLCEYCRSPEVVSADRFTVDHTLPQSMGGLDDLNNLALACRRCNERRSNFMFGTDPETRAEVSLFNPRQDLWAEHFVWTKDGIKILGVTSTGRATCQRLDMNDEARPAPFIQTSRQLWIKMGLHPPQTDPRLDA